MLTFILLGLAAAVPLALLMRQNVLEQRAMNEAYDLWRTTGEAVPGWDRHYAWSEPLPVDEPAWAEPSRRGSRAQVHATPPLPRLLPDVTCAPRPLRSRWDEASSVRARTDAGRPL